MLLNSNMIRAHSTTIRGVQYNVFSCYGGTESIFDRAGKLIEDSFQRTDGVEITKPFLVDNGIAFEGQ
jgi:hypothetical protein